MELKNQQYTLQKLVDVGFIVVELRIAEYTAVELKATGFTIRELIDGGFKIDALKDADYVCCVGYRCMQLCLQL